LIFLNNKGFTLIEVLISGLILFSALSLGTLAYRGSVRVIDKFTANVAIADAFPRIMSQVKQELMTHRLEGRGRLGRYVTFKWNSKVIKSSRNIISSYDEATGGLAYGRFLVSLNKIDVVVSYHRAGVVQEKGYEYYELSWFKR